MRRSALAPATLFACATACACSFSWAQTAAAETVRGTVEIPLTSPKVSEHSGHWSVWNGDAPTRDSNVLPPEAIVVLVASTAASAGESAAGCGIVRLNGASWASSTAATRTQVAIRLRNDGPFGHAIQIGDDSGVHVALDIGETYEIAATKPQVIQLRDSSHGGAMAHVHVVDNLVACARVDANKQFALTDLPAGEYTLRVLNEGRTVHEQPIAVHDDVELAIGGAAAPAAAPKQKAKRSASKRVANRRGGR